MGAMQAALALVRAFLPGLALGWLSLLGLWALLWATGGMAFNGPLVAQHLSLPLLLGAWGSALGVALLEEGLFRGLLLAWLARHLPPWLALAASALVYALAHFGAPGRFQQPWWAFAGLVGAGLVLGLGAWRRGGWVFSWGLHFGWLSLFLSADGLRAWRVAEGLAWWHGAGYPLGSLAGFLALITCACGLQFWPARGGVDRLQDGLPSAQRGLQQNP